jgi:transposase-like protein
MKFNELTKMTEDEARTYLESIHWPDGPFCPHCGATDVTKLQGKSTRPGVHKCKSKGCRKQFTVTVGTIFERSHIPLRDWVIAFHMMTASKKGISAHQLHRMLGCTYKTSWFMCHRIREAMRIEHGPQSMSGVVEADECYVGGKPRPGGPKGKGMKNTKKKIGRGTDKQAVFILIQRDGGAIATPIHGPTAAEIKQPIRDYVTKNSTIITDEYPGYKGIGKHFDGGHKTVSHRSKEYARREEDLVIHSNTAESFIALLKRGHYGTFHKLSKKHINRYCDEFSFRWTYRKVTDAERRERAIQGAEGKRLMYK